MADIDALKARLKNSTEKFLNSLEQIPEEKLYEKPKSGGWSAGEIAEHVAIVEGLVNGVVKGAKSPIERNPMEKAEQVGYEFLNFEKKFHFAGGPEPGADARPKADLIAQLSQVRNDLESLIGSEELEQECDAFEHGLFGKMTGVEWVYFNLYHSERHRRQMEAVVFPEKAAALEAPAAGRQKPQRMPRRKPKPPKPMKGSRRRR